MRQPIETVDLERIAECFDAYWQRRVPGRPLVGITAPRARQEPRGFPVPDNPAGSMTDIAFQRNEALWRARNTLYLGEVFPMVLPNIGPDSFTAYLGGELDFVNDYTSWVRPFVDDLADWTPEFDRANRWWRHMCELIETLCEVAPGNFLVGIPDMHGGGDCLAAARHPDRLAVDLYDRSKRVRELMDRLTEIYIEMYDEYYRRISRVQDGCTTWLLAYSRGTYCALQNDFSGLVSPEMFEEFFLPEVRELAGYLDNSIYHLDGPSAVGNLPHLLEVDELDGVQWVPGAAERMSNWVPLCRRVLEGGKCLHVGCEPDELLPLLEALPHAGLFISTWGSSEAHARRLWDSVVAEFGD